MQKLPCYIFLLLIFLSCFVYGNTVKVKYPNVVYLLADDLGIGDLRCYNQESKILTPAMDLLANSGVMFMDAHSGSSVCSPTRYGILTGRYAFRTRLKSGVLWGSSPCLIDKETETVASMLKKYGYNTACIGKWHLGLNWQTKTPGLLLTDNWQEDIPKIDFTKPILSGPNEFGFDYFYGIPASLDMPPYLFIENHNPQGIPIVNTTEGGREGITAPGFKAKDVMPVLTRKAVDFIQNQSANKPFFLFFPWSAPHTPVVPNSQFRNKSKAGNYGDFVMECDQTVKQIIDALKSKGLYENTILILTSDNGSSPHGFTIDDEIKYQHNTSNGFKGRKSHSYEGGHRVPFIVSWPAGIKSGSKTNQIICSTDLYATVCNVINHKLSKTEAPDSFSFLHSLTGRKSNVPVRESIIHHSLNGDFSIRKDNWKYIDAKGHGGFAQIREKVPTDSIQLYNLKKDISETKNVFLQHPAKVKELKALLYKHIAEGKSRN